MSVTTPPRPAPAPERGTPVPRSATSTGPGPRGRWYALLGVLVVWVGGWAMLQGQDTLVIGRADLTDVHEWLGGLDERLRGSVLLDATGAVSEVLEAVLTFLQELVSTPPDPRPVPEIGWLGVLSVATWVAYTVAGWKHALLTAASFAAFGLLGYWEESMDLLIVTFTAVTICLLVGIPIGVWMGCSKRATTVITPALDLLQTMPSFVYLLPLTLLFGIGAPAAVVATLVYALPPVTRITGHGIRTVSTSALEATTSMGSDRWQVLRKVQLPMARRTVIVGVNQTVMAALAMATIAALIAGPGLGEAVVVALSSLAVGTAFVAGLAIVVMAIMLDRVTTAAAERSEWRSRGGGGPGGTRRRVLLAGTGAIALVGLYLSRFYTWAAQFPGSPDLGTPIGNAVQEASDYVTVNLFDVTTAVADAVSYGLINPLEALIADSPWYLTSAALLAVSVVLGGLRSAVTTAVCLAIILGTGLWHDSMVTLATTLVATVLVMALALVLGVLIARSRTSDRMLRPVLDAGQVMPPFVYLVPALGLFLASRFTAIVAAVIYAAPAAIKLVADGIKSVSPTAVEAAESAGSNRRQVIAKVQLPMARSGIALAANQGLLYVFAMVVIGGLVGAGGLGYLVVSGFAQAELFGKGMAAGVAIVALAVMLDRITQYASVRGGRS